MNGWAQRFAHWFASLNCMICWCAQTPWTKDSYGRESVPLERCSDIFHSLKGFTCNKMTNNLKNILTIMYSHMRYRLQLNIISLIKAVLFYTKYYPTYKVK